ncbi:flagellar hook-associated protein FlgK [Undibacterium arcticum]|uniref:flagellar hook-associated protein FlgK n=1 Tax=Undibacterium arcticum TaxID=1762892 RepID=UPI00360A31DE
METYSSQINQVDNLLADASAGISPALQDFFSGLQDLSANPNAAASRQATLSSAQSLVARFQSLNDQLSESRAGVNSQISSSVTAINAYAQQIAKLNATISQAQGSGNPPNDLLDQRDQVIAELNKEVKVTVNKEDGGNYNVFIGNGQPLVMGVQVNQLATAPSVTDPERLQVAYQINGNKVVLPEGSLSGGRLSGLFDYRSQTLDPSQNALGRVAIVLATSFNAQHQLGQDQNGAPGGDFFTVATPLITPSSKNPSSAKLAASITNAGALSTSDYTLQYDGSNYKITQLPDGAPVSYATLPQTVDGVTFDLATGSPAMAAGDSFLVRPTINGAAQIDLAIKNPSLIAAAAPIRTAAGPRADGSGNTGSATISSGTVTNKNFSSSAPYTSPVTLSYSAATNKFSGYPAGTTVTLPGSTTAIPYDGTYTAGATISVGSASFVVSGVPADGDTFNIGPNTNGVGDNRNALLLGALQTANTVANGTTSFQGAYSQLVSAVGNKTREINVSSDAETARLDTVTQAQQSESGVNVDEETANLIRYQQAYQAAAKVMQTASTMFDVLLSLGH